jgi:MFS family permease
MQFKKSSTIFFISFYFLSYLCFSFLMTNYTPFLSELGYHAGERGYILSGYAVTTIVFQLWFGMLSDRYQTIKKIVILSLAVMGLGAGVLFSNAFTWVVIHFLLVALSGGLLNACCGMYDTWLLGSDDRLRNRMSFIKTFGSIGWAAGSVLASTVILRFSYLGLGASVVVLVFLMLINIIILPDIKKVSRPKKIDKNDLIELLHNRRYRLLLFVLFLMYTMVVTNNCTVIDKMMELGAGTRQISLKWFVQSLLEIPTYLLGAFLLKRFRSTRLLRISSLMLVVQFILFGVAWSVNQIIVISVLQLFSTPLILISSKMLIYDITPVHLRNSSQLIALSFFTGASSLVWPSLAGTISVYGGYNITLWLAAVLGVTAFMLIPRIFKKET